MNNLKFIEAKNIKKTNEIYTMIYIDAYICLFKTLNS